MSEHDSDPPRRAQSLEALRAIALNEAERVVAAAQLAPDPKRVSEGWTRRFIADGARAEEMVELYRHLGFEVVADPITPQDLGGTCEQCQLVMQLQFKVIYTRRPPRPPGDAAGDRAEMEE